MSGLVKLQREKLPELLAKILAKCSHLVLLLIKSFDMKSMVLRHNICSTFIG